MSTPATPGTPAWTPEFPGQRAPFTAGNTAALKSGYTSPRAIQQRAAVLLTELLAEAPDLDRPRFRFDAEAWAYAQARAELHREHEAVVGLFDPASGATRAALHDRVRAAERDAAQARDRLGLGPLAEARLRRDQSAAVAFAGPELLASRMAEGRAALDARATAAVVEAAPALTAAPDPGELHEDDHEENV
jgi:hypothetical protein